MDYKKKYKKVLARAREAKKETESAVTIGILEDIFPELRESEDERIRKMLIDSFTRADMGGEIYGKGVTYKQVIAWLEKQGEERKITHEEICKSYGIPDIGEFSDGYHTFNGLYKQRMILFAVLVKTYKDRAWKSWKHEDGLDCFGGGWFIVGIDTPAGTYTYHYEAKDWDRFDCQILEKAKHWDGHDEFDVERLFSLVSNAKKVPIWKHWKDGIAGNGEGKPIYLVKIGNTYSLTSCLGFECDYIELSELDNLMLEKQGERKSAEWSEEDERNLNWVINVWNRLRRGGDAQTTPSQMEYLENWLKDLKDRVQLQPKQDWRPNEEQMIALRQVISGCSYDIEPLLELETKLKEF